MPLSLDGFVLYKKVFCVYSDCLVLCGLYADRQKARRRFAGLRFLCYFRFCAFGAVMKC